MTRAHEVSDQPEVWRWGLTNEELAFLDAITAQQKDLLAAVGISREMLIADLRRNRPFMQT